MPEETRPTSEPWVMVCTIGCCPGCQDCYGMSIGCHQRPCRCKLPCTCDYEREDEDPNWRNGCQRHDSSEDQRNWQPDEFVEVEDEDLTTMTPCPVCGATTACSYDNEGLPLIHALSEDTED